jgi:hypothetical protein
VKGRGITRASRLAGPTQEGPFGMKGMLLRWVMV